MNPNMLKKQQREESILTTLDQLKFLSRSQLQQLHDLGSDRNASRVLKNMDKYVQSFRDGQNIYYLRKAGRERIGSNNVVNKSMNYNHILMRNQLYIYEKCPKYWWPEHEVTVGDKLKIVPDVIYKEQNGRICFVEIDNTQRMVNNKNKINKYKKLKELGVFQNKEGYFPVIVWVTTSEIKRNRLIEYCNKEKLMNRVYTLKDLQ